MSDKKDSQDPRPDESLDAGDYAPRQYSFRSSAITTIKLVLLGSSAFGALWLLDKLVTN